MVEFLTVWAQVLDEAITGVVYFFEQTNAYLRIDYTEPLRIVKPQAFKKRSDKNECK